MPTREDAATVAALLARTASGQDLSVYTTFSTGARREADPDGPREYHVVLLDNGRSNMLGGEFREMLRCIRCGACMNHCPVYHAVGGHAYGWVYPGPMGAVLTPSLVGVEQGGQSAERFDLLRPLRGSLPGADSAAETDAALARARIRAPPVAGDGALRARALGGFFAKRPALYRAATSFAMNVAAAVRRQEAASRALPLAGGWTRHRDFPSPQGETFQSLWKKRTQRR